MFYLSGSFAMKCYILLLLTYIQSLLFALVIPYEKNGPVARSAAELAMNKLSQ